MVRGYAEYGERPWGRGVVRVEALFFMGDILFLRGGHKCGGIVEGRRW